MPKVIDPELKARAVRLVLEHRAEYPTTTATVFAVAKQVGESRNPYKSGKKPGAVHRTS